MSESKVIDDIVAAVLSQLKASAKGDATPVPQSAEKAPAITIDAAVITESVLEKQWERKNVLKIGDRSLLTPSAKDFLKRNHVDWVRASTTVQPAESEGGAGRWLFYPVSVTKSGLSVSDRVIKNSKMAFRRELVGCPAEATDHATAELLRGAADGAIVITNEPEVAACRANRSRGIRGCVATDPDQVDRVTRQLNPNYWAVTELQAFRFGQILNAIVSRAASGRRKETS
ncbi:hypothetical protein [Stratiformator vulcanicus]|uniref:Uncharacterized protein n=1 Tax=Stratiformator vulcanicus TaxID=2527980 RepID=A0A517QXV7_9PLAN|nr:hypothetical protein [Stratiformator vulcanicus]QDT36485.1 hypothetical protein Pan189_08420 [Stratiformator vulcanicus]